MIDTNKYEGHTTRKLRHGWMKELHEWMKGHHPTTTWIQNSPDFEIMNKKAIDAVTKLNENQLIDYIMKLLNDVNVCEKYIYALEENLLGTNEEALK